jgi:hypothetical protein
MLEALGVTVKLLTEPEDPPEAETINVTSAGTSLLLSVTSIVTVAS